MPSRQTNRTRRPKRNTRAAPQLQYVEDTALATADTVSNITLYNPTAATGTLELPTSFRLRSATITIGGGATANRVLAIIRRVPNGYSFPTVTVATGLTTFQDFSNILAYGFVTTGAIVDPDSRIDMRLLKSNITVYPGDTIAMQTVSNISSVGQTYSAMLEYSLA